MENIIEIRNLLKKYKKFTLDIPSLNFPKGFATALIGENGAGKSTLLDIISGIDLDFKGKIKYFDNYDTSDESFVHENIGYTSATNYFMQSWTSKEVCEICDMLFESFDKESFDKICRKLKLIPENEDKSGKINSLSDGNKMRLMLSSAFARDTKILIMDEPASPLDPVMRDTLCDMIREYLVKSPERSVIFSTHNISDMENVTDYAVIVSGGKITECGFVEDLKEKYILVKGEKSCAEKARKFMYSYSESNFGFEGIILSENMNKLAGTDVKFETPTLHQISVCIMKHEGEENERN